MIKGNFNAKTITHNIGSVDFQMMTRMLLYQIQGKPKLWISHVD